MRGVPPGVAVTLTLDQLALRREGLTASDMVALSGTVPFKKRRTVFDVFLDKVHPDKVKPTEVTEAMELGHEAEPLIVERVARKLKLAVAYPQRTVRHAKIDWAMATPDAKVVGAPYVGIMSASAYEALGLIETKLVGFFVADCWGDNEDIEHGPPDYVYTQVVWQMFVTNLPFCIVGAMIGTEIRTYRVEYDAGAREYAETLVEIGAKFRKDHVLTGREPPVDGSEASREMLAALFQKSNGARVQAPLEAEMHARVYFEARKRKAEAEEQMAVAKTMLLDKIRDNECLVGDGWQCAWREQKAHDVTYHVDAHRAFDLRALKR